jgi:hypothetical protein
MGRRRGRDGLAFGGLFEGIAATDQPSGHMLCSPPENFAAGGIVGFLRLATGRGAAARTVGGRCAILRRPQ